MSEEAVNTSGGLILGIFVVIIVFVALSALFVTQAIPFFQGFGNKGSNITYILTVYSETNLNRPANPDDISELFFEIFKLDYNAQTFNTQPNFLLRDNFDDVWVLKGLIPENSEGYQFQYSSLTEDKKKEYLNLIKEDFYVLTSSQKQDISSFINEFLFRECLYSGSDETNICGELNSLIKRIPPKFRLETIKRIKENDYSEIINFQVDFYLLGYGGYLSETVSVRGNTRTVAVKNYEESVSYLIYPKNPEKNVNCSFWKEGKNYETDLDKKYNLDQKCEFSVGNKELILEATQNYILKGIQKDKLIWEFVDEKGNAQIACKEDGGQGTAQPLHVCTILLTENKYLRVLNPLNKVQE